jgi:hypothetical protein
VKNSIYSLILFVAALMFLELSAQAQPYYTNTTTVVQPIQYNDNLTQPLVPSDTMTLQRKAGILAGASVTTTDGTVTNSFGYAIYTVPPAVHVTQVGITITTTNVVSAVTTSNFVYRAGVTGVTNTWISVGH